MIWLFWISFALAETGLVLESDAAEIIYVSLNGIETTLVVFTWLVMTGSIYFFSKVNHEIEKYKLKAKIELAESNTALISQQLVQLKKTYQPLLLSQERLNILIRLCHPDRHKDSKESTEMMKWLLSQRKKQ